MKVLIELEEIIYFNKVITAYLGHPSNDEARELAIEQTKRLERLKVSYE